MIRRPCALLFVVVVLGLSLALPAPAQNTSALINEALDKLVKLDLDTTLPVAMRAIGEQTGVTFSESSNTAPSPASCRVPKIIITSLSCLPWPSGSCVATIWILMSGLSARKPCILGMSHRDEKA